MPSSKVIHPRLIKRCNAGYRDPCSTCNTSSEPRSIDLAMACPCAGPRRSVRRMSKSSVPWSNSIRSRSALVDILGGDDTPAHLECQGEPAKGKSHEFRADNAETPSRHGLAEL